jgi:hypothetical protein
MCIPKVQPRRSVARSREPRPTSLVFAGHLLFSIGYRLFIMQLTHFLAQLLGLYCVIISVVMLARKQAIMEMVPTLIENRPLLFIVEILGVIGGLAMVLGHNVWSGGFLAFIITLIGWATLVRSTVLLFLSPQAIARFIKAIRYEQNYYVFATITLLLGLYLTSAGFAK